MIQLAIVDDHPIARWGLEHLAAGATDLEVVCSAASVAELADLDCDVLTLDLFLGGATPALAGIRKLSADRPVLVVSASARPSDVRAALQAGARGYLTKDSSDEEMLSAIRTVAAGGFVLSPSVAAAVRGAAANDPAPTLSPREQEAISYVARGFTHAQAAARMNIAASTFESYIERIRNKLGVGNKAELTRHAIAHGLVDGPSAGHPHAPETPAG